MSTVHDVKIFGMTADKKITIQARGSLTVHDEPVGTPPEVPTMPGTPEQPIYTPPPTAQPVKQ